MDSRSGGADPGSVSTDSPNWSELKVDEWDGEIGDSEELEDEEKQPIRYGPSSSRWGCHLCEDEARVSEGGGAEEDPSETDKQERDGDAPPTRSFRNAQAFSRLSSAP